MSLTLFLTYKELMENERMIKKMFAKKNILKAVSIITSMLMVMSSFACIPSVNIEGKGNDIANANIVPKEEDNTGSG